VSLYRNFFISQMPVQQSKLAGKIDVI